MKTYKFKNGPIEQYSWGKYVIAGKTHKENGKIVGVGKDICIIGDDVSSWKERVGHQLNPMMISGVYGKKIKILIIGIGAEKALKCPKKVIKEIHENGIKKVILLATPKACNKYNELYS